MGCNICNSGSIGAKWTKELQLNTRSLRSAALEFNMTIEEVMEHVNEHEMPKEAEESLVSLLDDPNFFYNELLMLHKQMKEWLTFTMETDNLDRSNIELGLKLQKEIRETLKLIAELDGKLSKGNVYKIQVNQLKGDFTTLLGTVISEVCPECQVKILEAIDSSKQLKGDILDASIKVLE